MITHFTVIPILSTILTTFSLFFTVVWIVGLFIIFTTKG